MLFHILHILSILTGPNIFLNICLSKIRRLFSFFAVKAQVYDEYVTTGLIVVLYILILVFNLLKPTGYVIHKQFNIQQLYTQPTLHLCVLYLSENKQRIVPLTA